MIFFNVLNCLCSLQIQDTHIDTRVASAPTHYRPRFKPLLHKIQRKDPVELENAGYGPGMTSTHGFRRSPFECIVQCFVGYMSTEASSRFRGQPNDSSLPTFMSVGAKEFSGFTHNKNIEPVSFHPDYAHSGDHPGSKRRTHKCSKPNSLKTVDICLAFLQDTWPTDRPVSPSPRRTI